MQTDNTNSQINTSSVSAEGVLIGRIQEISPQGIWVTHAYATQPVLALSTQAIELEHSGREVALLFNQITGQPIIMGIIHSPIHDLLKQDATPTLSSGIQIMNDGQHCNITAEKSITLTCGKSSVTMTRDGEISINGEKITSKARKSQKIIGGSVHIN
ncbi:MAG: hypothetical protein ACI978_002798 [Oleispira sp.]|jgi:hypothetical protein